MAIGILMGCTEYWALARGGRAGTRRGARQRSTATVRSRPRITTSRSALAVPHSTPRGNGAHWAATLCCSLGSTLQHSTTACNAIVYVLGGAGRQLWRSRLATAVACRRLCRCAVRAGVRAFVCARACVRACVCGFAETHAAPRADLHRGLHVDHVRRGFNAVAPRCNELHHVATPTHHGAVPLHHVATRRHRYIIYLLWMRRNNERTRLVSGSRAHTRPHGHDDTCARRCACTTRTRRRSRPRTSPRGTTRSWSRGCRLTRRYITAATMQHGVGRNRIQR